MFKSAVMILNFFLKIKSNTSLNRRMFSQRKHLIRIIYKLRLKLEIIIINLQVNIKSIKILKLQN